MRRLVFLVFFIANLVLLYFGLTLTFLSSSVDLRVRAPIANFEQRVMDQTLSIFGTIEHLYEQDKLLVSFLIFLFSVLIPLFKILALPVVVFKNNRKPMRFVNFTSKWSMADVMTVAILLALLSFDSVTNSTQQVFGMTIGLQLEAQSHLGNGFYCFLAYCLLSIGLVQWVDHTSQ